MSGIKIGGDMKDVEAWKGGAILPVGLHNVIIDSAVEGQSSGGHAQVELLFRSEVGLGEIRDWLTFPEDPMSRQGALGRAKMLLEAAGVEVSADEDWVFPTNDLVGKRLEISVIEEPKWNDRTKMVKKVNAFAAQSDVPGADTRDLPGTKVVADDQDVPF